MELGDLFPELIEHILSLVPLKPRTRLKCVSKTWCDMITRIRHYTPETTSHGLVLSLLQWHPDRHSGEIISSKTTFITVKDYGEEGFEQTSLSISLPAGFKLINSCNGLLLYAVKDGYYYTDFYVCSPITKQYIAIPCIHEVSTYGFAGIAFDGLQQNFKLICYDKDLIKEDDEEINCHIFSSETGEWKIHRARLENTAMMYALSISNCRYSSLYYEGNLYCIFDFYVVVYDVERNLFKMSARPFYDPHYRSNFDGYFPYILYVSEGRLHFCQSSQKNICKLVTYVNVETDDDDTKYGNSYYEEWELKAEVDVFKLREQMRKSIEDLVTEEELKMFCHYAIFRAEVISFNEDLQIVYLQISDIVFAYSLETRRVTKVWFDPSAHKNNQHVMHSFLFKPVDLSLISGCRQLSTLTTTE